MDETQHYVLHASICQALANPKRLEIIDRLSGDEMSVTQLAQATQISQANLSQHLAVMRQKGIVASRRDGLNVYYKLSNPKILQACNLMRQVLLEYLETGAEITREGLR